MNIDPDRSADVIRAAKPGIVTFGGSLFLFPHPIKELKAVCDEVGAYVAYDASHVLGLVAGGVFQDPLREGADFITSTTHKTFPGPQGGVDHGQRTNEPTDGESHQKNSVRSLPTERLKHSPGQVASLGIAALEMKLFGNELAKQIVKNAQTAGQYLYENGVKVLCEHKGFTRSHQIAVDIRSFWRRQQNRPRPRRRKHNPQQEPASLRRPKQQRRPLGLTHRLPRRHPTRLPRRRH